MSPYQNNPIFSSPKIIFQNQQKPSLRNQIQKPSKIHSPQMKHLKNNLSKLEYHQQLNYDSRIKKLLKQSQFSSNFVSNQAQKKFQLPFVKDNKNDQVASKIFPKTPEPFRNRKFSDQIDMLKSNLMEKKRIDNQQELKSNNTLKNHQNKFNILQHKFKDHKQLNKWQSNKLCKRSWIQNQNFNISETIPEKGQIMINVHNEKEIISKKANRKLSFNIQSTQIVKHKPTFLNNLAMLQKQRLKKKSFNQKQTTLNDFIIIKQLGKGTFGQVYLTIQKTSGGIYALKKISKEQILKQNMLIQLIRQLKIQTYCEHPNIVKIYHFFYDKEYIYIILQCALEGDLRTFSQINNNNIHKQKNISHIINQLCQSIAYIHSKNIIHRDLKLQNVLIHMGVAKLCDFGWSIKRQPLDLRSTFCGTPLYLCPQMLIGDQYDESIDIWALGVIVYQLFYQQNPFKIQTNEQLSNILQFQLIFDVQKYISNDAKQFINGCLKKKASERPNIKELLIHNFLLNYKL